jgi:lambda repressor-like predicted transcriptional regulator
MKIFALSFVTAASAALASAPAAAQPASHAQHHAEESRNPMFRTPASIAAEHRELHATLERASREAGALGAAARELEAALSPHFRREEEIATPALGLLPSLASGEVTPAMRAVLPLTDALERELPQMLKEHQAIRAAAGKFRSAAEAAGQADYVRFSDELAAHAREEEEILYPAAILVGRHVKLSRGK